MKALNLGILLSLFISANLLAETPQSPMKKFLVSCGYGMAGGAAVGLVSLAFEPSPETKLNNIARGASLGLYAGIGYGLYQIYGKKSDNQEINWTVLPANDGAQFLFDWNY
jgi:hypothetical protein